VINVEDMLGGSPTLITALGGMRRFTVGGDGRPAARDKRGDWRPPGTRRRMMSATPSIAVLVPVSMFAASPRAGDPDRPAAGHHSDGAVPFRGVVDDYSDNQTFWLVPVIVASVAGGYAFPGLRQAGRCCHGAASSTSGDTPAVALR